MFHKFDKNHQPTDTRTSTKPKQENIKKTIPKYIPVKLQAKTKIKGSLKSIQRKKTYYRGTTIRIISDFRSEILQTKRQ